MVFNIIIIGGYEMDELLVKLKEKLLQKECSLEALAQEFNLSELEIMGYVRMLKNRSPFDR